MGTEKKQSETLARLVDLVQEQIAKDPYERDGKLWWKDPYSLAPAFGKSERTMRRWFNAHPTVFKLQPVIADDRRVLLVRLAEEGEPVAVNSCETPRCEFMRQPGAARVAPL